MTSRQEIMKPAPKVEIATFHMLNNNFRVLQRPTSVDGNIFHITTVDNEGNDLCFIQGIYLDLDQRRMFASSYIANLQRSDSQNPASGYVPHIVGMTIAELLVQHKIDVWRSAPGVSALAIRMYERFLGTMDRLQVSSPMYSSYEVRRKEV